MVCTEKEAIEKWCPYIRFVTINNLKITNRHQRSHDPYHNTHCIGSKCMKWTWRDDNHDIGYCDA